jgi:hypothetical protein
MTSIAVFAYASLVDPASAALTLGRRVSPPRPARLPGWRRRWSVARDNLRSEKTFAIDPGRTLPPWVLGLNLEPAPEPGDEASDAAPNGALLEISEAELARLDLREMRYERIEVTAAIGGEHRFDRVIAYRAKAQHHAPDPPPGAVVLGPYLRTVERAFAALGEGELEAYRRSTGPVPVRVVEPELIRDRIPPGNPRAW